MSNVSASTSTPSKGLNIALWVAQGLLAFAFIGAGMMKLTKPMAELAAGLPLAATAPLLVRFIGLAEVLGAVGVILPAATRIKPQLTPLAALGLLVIMALAAVFHLTRSEFGNVPVNLVLGGLAAFVAWGRSKKVPIAPRG